MSCRSLRVLTAGGSTAKFCAPMGALPEFFSAKLYRWENPRAEILIPTKILRREGN